MTVVVQSLSYKRRKLDISISVTSQIWNQQTDDMVIDDEPNREQVIKEQLITDVNTTKEIRKIDSNIRDCPCGFLHGAGQGNHEDLHAVGLSNQPLLRGPD